MVTVAVNMVTVNMVTVIVTITIPTSAISSKSSVSFILFAISCNFYEKQQNLDEVE